MAIRVAMCMGLNNVVADKPGEIAAPGLYKREVCSLHLSGSRNSLNRGLVATPYMVQYRLSRLAVFCPHG